MQNAATEPITGHYRDAGRCHRSQPPPRTLPGSVPARLGCTQSYSQVTPCCKAVAPDAALGAQCLVSVADGACPHVPPSRVPCPIVPAGRCCTQGSALLPHASKAPPWSCVEPLAQPGTHSRVQWGHLSVLPHVTHPPRLCQHRARQSSHVTCVQTLHQEPHGLGGLVQ